MSRNYWLFKSEPDAFSLDDLRVMGHEHWDGVRNYQACNMLRDDIHEGDGVLFYHSRIKEPAVVGIAQVARSGYPDFTAWNPESKYFDPRASAEKPVWYMVDVAFVAQLPTPVTLNQIKGHPALTDMMVARKGSRLSVQPVRPEEWRAVLALGGIGVDPLG
ncbi:MAG: EVE domain-containing protein [Alphaproteobacteria bacterium CG_4_10_14_0_2_um_filter_63_37]|nr:MAG: EVE domain-containing protein [Proteobacteria bacterium CG1_02_64_396]PJA25953.1 MAG: EVE domain-containing protein [Alphaproteobacteria bacterium CG_4_10_14_0_2_um_filter_63_37]